MDIRHTFNVAMCDNAAGAMVVLRSGKSVQATPYQAHSHTTKTVLQCFNQYTPKGEDFCEI